MSDTELLAGLALFGVFSWLGCLALFATRQHRTELRLQLRLFLWAFALRFACSMALYQLGLVAIFKDEDASGWEGGVGLQQQWLQEGIGFWQLPFVWAGAFDQEHRGYHYLLGALFYLTDAPYRLAAAALNGLFGALTVVFAYRVARSLFSPAVANRVGWWVCLFPSMIIWSAQTVKEPVIIFLETVALYGCVRLRQQGFSPRHLALCAATIALLLPFRFYAAYIVAGAVLLSLMAPALFQRRSAAASLGLVVVLLPLVLATGSIASHEARLERFNLEKVESFRRNVASGGERWGGRSGVRTEDVRTTSGLIRGTAIGAAHLLLAPFPWQLPGASARMLLALPELLVWWWLFFAGVIPGLTYAIRHRLADVSVLLLFVLGFGLLYSMLFGNIGLAVRQRAQLLPWLLVFAAIGLEHRAGRRRAAHQLRTTIDLPPQPYAQTVPEALR